MNNYGGNRTTDSANQSVYQAFQVNTDFVGNQG